MDSDLQQLIALLDLETIDVDLYRGVTSVGRRPRVYGGQVAAQALVAAGRTVPEDRPVHSLHAYFMRPGDPHHPIVYDVDRLRDGRSFTTRRVRARQHGKAIFTLEASFQLVETGGLTHQPTLPDVPDPETLPPGLPDPNRRADARREWVGELQALDFRTVPTDEPTPARDVPSRFWFRPVGPVPTDRLLQAAILTYASDHTLLVNILRRHGRWFDDDDIMMASIDHAMWFHCVGDVSGWMLYEVQSPAAGGSRGLAFGHIYAADGMLLCSTAQEGLARLVDPDFER